jgi:hypothetical protein
VANIENYLESRVWSFSAFTKATQKNYECYTDLKWLDTRTGTVVSPQDIGVGMSQVLPILIEACTGGFGKLIAIEQPELHLHSALQRKLADFFVMSKPSKQFLLETHSEQLLLGFIDHIKKGTLHPKSVSLLYVESTENSGSKVHRIPLNDDGTLDLSDIRKESREYLEDLTTIAKVFPTAVAHVSKIATRRSTKGLQFALSPLLATDGCVKIIDTHIGHDKENYNVLRDMLIKATKPDCIEIHCRYTQEDCKRPSMVDWIKECQEEQFKEWGAEIKVKVRVVFWHWRWEHYPHTRQVLTKSETQSVLYAVPDGFDTTTAADNAEKKAEKNEQYEFPLGVRCNWYQQPPDNCDHFDREFNVEKYKEETITVNKGTKDEYEEPCCYAFNIGKGWGKAKQV